MKRAIELLENLIKEHEESNFCTNWDEAQDELDAERAAFLGYDCGRYETLTKLLDELKLILYREKHQK